jgi:hypothetical protein
MTEEEYIAYFEDLASKNVHIQHSSQQPRVYITHGNSRTEIDQAVRSGLKLPCVVLDQYYDDFDRTHDNFRLRIMGGLTVLTKCRVSDPKDVRRAQNEARKIAISFINRMYKDCRHPSGELFDRRIIPSTVFQGEPAPPVGGEATGWGYPFEWEMPTSVAVNPDDWTDLQA